LERDIESDENSDEDIDDDELAEDPTKIFVV
jgi:hypothetical protein